MKQKFFIALAAFFMAIAAGAQSTVDSIAAKYKMLPMPDSLTTEQTFPVLGAYTINNPTDSSSNLTITLDPSNKGIVWVEGLPQGKVKAYLKKSPATYRIMAQKSENGKQIPEGTLIYDSTTHMLNIAMGKAYDEADPGAVFTVNTAMDSNTGNATATSTMDSTAAGTKKSHTVKMKAKTATAKTKAKVMLYTATKVQSGMSNSMNSNTNMNNQSATDSTKHQ